MENRRDRLGSQSKKRKCDDIDIEIVEDSTNEVFNDDSSEIPWTEVVKRIKGLNKSRNASNSKAPGAWRKQRHAFGAAKAGDDDDGVVTAADVTLVASGVSTGVTADQLRNFVCKKGLQIKTCSLLTNLERNPDARSHTFKMTINSEDYEKSKEGSFWPYRVYVRLFKNFKNKKDDVQEQQMKEILGQTEA